MNRNKIRLYQLPDGTEIMAGKTAEANEYLSTKWTLSDDLWFHAADMPGAHVILRGPNKEEHIKIAAAIAGFYSATTSDLVEVNYTLGCNVSKPKGAKLGLMAIKDSKKIKVQKKDHSEFLTGIINGTD